MDVNIRQGHHDLRFFFPGGRQDGGSAKRHGRQYQDNRNLGVQKLPDNTDNNPDTYTIELSGSGIITGPTFWDSGTGITYEIPDGLDPGEYIYTIIIEDDFGNSVSDSVTFTVTEKPEDPKVIPFGNTFLIFTILSFLGILVVMTRKIRRE